MTGNGEQQELELPLGFSTGSRTTNALPNNTDVTLSFKVNKNFTNGWVYLIALDNGGGTVSSEIGYLLDGAVTSGFQEYSCTFNTGDAKDTYKYIFIRSKVEAGEAIYIDDIKFTANGVNYYPEGSFDTSANITDNTPVEGMVYNPISKSDLTFNQYTIENNNNVEICSDGVKGSYAMQFKGNGSDQVYHFLIGKQSGILDNTKAYELKFDVKKISGTVNKLTMGVSYDCTDANISVGNDNILTNKWLTYSVIISSVTGGYDFLNIVFNGSENTKVCIDNISITEVGKTKNFFPLGSFDFSAIKSNTQSVLPTGISYSAYNRAELETIGINNSNVTISDAGCGINNSYALKITGTSDNVCSVNEIIGLNKLNSDTEYTVSFGVKKSNANDEIIDFAISFEQHWITEKAFEIPQETVYDSELEEYYTNIGNGITTDYQTYTFKYSPIYALANSSNDTYNTFIITTELSEGSVIYIDSIKIYPSNKSDADNLIVGDFERIIVDYDDVSVPEDSDPMLPAHNNYQNINRVVKPIDNNYKLAIGFNDATDNGALSFGVTSVKPGKQYRIRMTYLPIGNINEFKVFMTDGGDGAEPNVINQTNLLNFGTEFDAQNPTKKFYNSVWNTLDVIYTDTTSIDNPSPSYPTMAIYYRGTGNDNGVIVDDISVVEINSFGDSSPNLFAYGTFEIENDLNIVYGNKYYSNDDSSDFSFMQNLDKQIAAFGVDINMGADEYNHTIDRNAEFDYLNTVFINTSNPEIAKFEAKKAISNGKDIWVNVNPILWDNGFDYWTNEALTTVEVQLKYVSDVIQSIAGDAFLGFYIDEPYYSFNHNTTNFVNFTKYLRETFKKRVFVVHDGSVLEDEAELTVNTESHRYITDIGYWCYSSDAVVSYAPRWTPILNSLNANVRKWICPLAGEGAKGHETETKESILNILTVMLDEAKEIDGFGGIVLYTFSGDANGYDALKLDSNGIAEHENYRKLLMAASNEFAGSDFIKENFTLIDDVILVNEIGARASVLTGVTGVYPYDNINLSVKNNEIEITDILKTGYTLNAECVAKKPAKYSIAVKFDANGDGAFDIRDLVRAKRYALNSLTPTKAQAVACGANNGLVSATEIVSMRRELLNGN